MSASHKKLIALPGRRALVKMVDPQLKLMVEHPGLARWATARMTGDGIPQAQAER
jgi:hypothetical protein